jgi:hypothetical protein
MLRACILFVMPQLFCHVLVMQAVVLFVRIIVPPGTCCRREILKIIEERHAWYLICRPEKLIIFVNSIQIFPNSR